MRHKMAASIYNVYVGSGNGLFKGINVNKNTFQNLNGINSLNRDNEITALCWGDSAQTEVYLGLRNQTVKIYDTSSHCFTKDVNVSAGKGSLRGLASFHGKFVTAVESGQVKLWSEEGEEQMKLDAGPNLWRMRQNCLNTHVIATGGQENDLKIWDLENAKQPIFRAKNVRNDFLDLRVPVWVMDMQFIPDSEKIVVCTGHHQVRVYDPSTPQRRPVIDMKFDDYPLMALSLTQKENQLVVGNSRGRMALLDLRKKAMVHAYKGFAGSIRCVQCHPTLPLVASCGLDRFLRIHELNTHNLLVKMYLKSRLNCLLMSCDYKHADENEKSVESNVQDSVVQQDEDDEEMWGQMEVVTEQTRQKRQAVDQNPGKCGSKKIFTEENKAPKSKNKSKGLKKNSKVKRKKEA